MIQTRGFSCVGLYNPKNGANIGGALRAASCYQASLVAIVGRRTVRYPTDTHKTWRHTPVLFTLDLFGVMPHDCAPVAVEFLSGALLLPDYTHPARAMYIFGPEDGTLGRKILDRCRDVVQVPTQFCMNLAATVNVVLYDRMAKERRSR